MPKGEKELLQAMIAYLLEENGERVALKEENLEQLETIWRGLVNQRPARSVSATYLDFEDTYLEHYHSKQRIATWNTCEKTSYECIRLYVGDACCLAVDGLVNAANSELLGCFIPNHACIDNAIHTFAGVRLRLMCHELMRTQGRKEAVGQAKITPAYHLPATYLIHTVGPYVAKGSQPSAIRQDLLKKCYRSCLDLAAKNGLRTLAFPCLSTGQFGFPKDLAAHLAITQVLDWLEKSLYDLNVIFILFDEESSHFYRSILT